MVSYTPTTQSEGKTLIRDLTLGDQKTEFHQASHHNEQGSPFHAQLHKEIGQPSLQNMQHLIGTLSCRAENQDRFEVYKETNEVNNLFIYKPPNASPMHCKPKQTPNNGIEGPSFVTVCKDIPES